MPSWERAFLLEQFAKHELDEPRKRTDKNIEMPDEFKEMK